MAMPHSSNATQLLHRLQKGDPAAAESLLPLVYDEFRRLAEKYLQREAPGHTLQPTALVHEAFLKLIDQKRVDWQGRTHFFAVGASNAANSGGPRPRPPAR